MKDKLIQTIKAAYNHLTQPLVESSTDRFYSTYAIWVGSVFSFNLRCGYADT